MGIRLIRNQGMVEKPGSAILGVAFFPEFSPAPGISNPVRAVSSNGTVRGNDEELLRRAYRKGYAKGYSTSWAVQRRRAASVLKVLRRLRSDIQKKAERARHDVEARVDDIARKVAADLVADEVAASSAER